MFENSTIRTKGQIKPIADWRAVDSPTKRTNEFGFFAVKSKKQKKKTEFVRLFFGRIYGAPICLRFYLTFSCHEFKDDM